VRSVKISDVFVPVHFTILDSGKTLKLLPNTCAAAVVAYYHFSRWEKVAFRFKLFL